jgi:beta-lactamase class C
MFIADSMMRLNILKTVAAKAVATLCLVCWLPSTGQAADGRAAEIEKIVAQTIRPMMQSQGIPGMAVAVVVDGQRYVYEFGVMSKATGQPVTRDTLFEIGSVSKTFTATLVSVAQVGGQLSLSDPASKFLPALRGSSFDKISLLDLGTHTSGGLPLQFPGGVTNDDQMMRYFREWKPTHTPGTVRNYANPSIGLLGMIAARSLNDGFDVLMERRVFGPLGLRHTHLQVPKAAMPHYAQGYTKQDAPARMMPGLRASEAYGVKTTAGDLLRFVEANMGLVRVEADLQRAIMATHTGYYRVGAMTQDLIWEQYVYPVDLKDLLAGNSSKMSLGADPVDRIDPPSQPRDDVWINKTGSTNGFGSYVAFVPAKKIGIVLLANKNYPNEARVTAVHGILTRLIGNAP